MTPDQRLQLLTRTGEALYGARWQSAISEDLRTSDRTIRRWVAGDTEIPWGVMAELRGLLMARGVAINGIIADMDTPLTPAP